MYVLRDKKTNKPLYLAYTKEGLQWATDSKGKLLYFKKAKLENSGNKLVFKGNLELNSNVYIAKYKKVYHKDSRLNLIEKRFNDLSAKYL